MKLMGLGVIMTFLAGNYIFWNVAQTRYNQEYIREHPWTTFFSGGSNLKHAYTFMPPYTVVELIVLTVGATGAVLVLRGTDRPVVHLLYETQVIGPWPIRRKDPRGLQSIVGATFTMEGDFLHRPLNAVRLNRCRTTLTLEHWSVRSIK